MRIIWKSGKQLPTYGDSVVANINTHRILAKLKLVMFLSLFSLPLLPAISHQINYLSTSILCLVSLCNLVSDSFHLPNHGLDWKYGLEKSRTCVFNDQGLWSSIKKITKLLWLSKLILLQFFIIITTFKQSDNLKEKCNLLMFPYYNHKCLPLFMCQKLVGIREYVFIYLCNILPNLMALCGIHDYPSLQTSEATLDWRYCPT